MTNNKLSKIIRKEDVILMVENDMRLALRDVKYVTDISMNWITVSKIDNEGFWNTFKDGT